MWLSVVLAIDERLDDVKRCVGSLRRVYGPDCPVALATYGGVEIGPQPKIRAYAEEQGLLYAEMDRQSFLTPDDSREWHSCEALARIQITRHFMTLGYEEIYIMHADVVILGNFREYYKAAITGAKWSFVGVLLRTGEPFEALTKKGSWAIYFEGNRARLSDLLVMYNVNFVQALYKEYETDAAIWKRWLSRFMLWSDLAQFDMARDWNEFKGFVILESDDVAPICHGSVLHDSRQKLPEGLENKTMSGQDMSIMQRNFERRTR
jgi:hypothetical protein